MILITVTCGRGCTLSLANQCVAKRPKSCMQVMVTKCIYMTTVANGMPYLALIIEANYATQLPLAMESTSKFIN